MEYIHPKHYQGLKVDTPNNQNIVKLRVEKYCFKCDLFMGNEHDFSECRVNDKWENGKVVLPKTCPFDHIAVALINAEQFLECQSE